MEIISSHCYWTTGVLATTGYLKDGVMTQELQAAMLCGDTPLPGEVQELSFSPWPWADTGNPVLEAEKFHLWPETGASSRRAASRTVWGGPGKAALCPRGVEAARELKGGWSERGRERPPVVPLVFSSIWPPRNKSILVASLPFHCSGSNWRIHTC